jgi:multidrug efflux pump subunit AcrA (membrane-fusion protein)
MAILPLRRPRGEEGPQTSAGEGLQKTGEIIGALIIEQIESDIPREVLNPRLELVYEHSGRAITNALDHSTMFLMPVWKTLGKAAWVVQARTLPKTLFISALVLLVLIGMIVIPWEYDMKAKGELQPKFKNDVFALNDMQVTQVLVENGQRVAKGEVLCVGVNNDLNLKLSEAKGKLSAAEAQHTAVRTALQNPTRKMSDAEQTEMAGRLLQLDAQIATANEEIASLEEKQKNLQIKSPIDGVIISWDVRKQLENRPVQTGQVLMTVADVDKGWELNLFMRQSRIGHVNEARTGKHPGYNFLWTTWWGIRGFTPRPLTPDLPVQYIVLSDPANTRHGKVMRVDEVSQQHEQEGHVVRVRVSTDEKMDGVRAGTTVKADVYCGYQPVGWVLFHEAWEWLETNVFFW